MKGTAPDGGFATGSQHHGVPTPNRDQHWLDPVAVVGIHARFPGSACETLDEYWQNLIDCRDCVGPPPDDRFWPANAAGQAEAAGVREGGFIRDVDAFDAAFFGIQEEEARLMDPLQRLALESAWHCVEDAGYRAADLGRDETGVFFAAGKSDYEELLYRDGTAAHAKLATGVATSIVSNRVSFALGLTGPSLAVDTACSGSLAALHLAAQALRNGDCTAAIVGAVNLILHSTLSLSLKEEGALSPECRTKSFDAAGNGYARGEGAASLLLKRLDDAEADGDHIYGLLIGSAISHGGRANWLTAPNAVAQKQLMVKAWRRAGVDPRSVSYIEAHGTGTPLGDAIEFNAISQAYGALTAGQAQDGQPHCRIGSVKANIGHVETASGLAGVIKVLLAMQHGKIPGNPHLTTVNPMCETDGTPFRFVRETEDWQTPRGPDGSAVPRRAAINSFGFGGALGHAVLEERRQTNAGADNQVSSALPVLPLSAKDEAGLRRYAQRLHRFVKSLAESRGETGDRRPHFDDFVYTFQVGRTPFPVRLALVAQDWPSLEDLLARLEAGDEDSDILRKGRAPLPAVAPRDELTESTVRFAQQWVDGEKVDFASLYTRGQRRRVSAPGYPFARSRIWFRSRLQPVA
ncbi:beta-ketoacyl synthase N-terminal-like domain-containing protein [Nitratireductor alexandrii]|uniref:beta-ketoacyl synthase N-terminal-like domain-containing protein n=1 Tax=Nitratireductor alexandrii TaxID=2448161 RepID=UPI0013E0BD85|nr:polyketide synthase [Nitratireductor alexandrii]